MKDACAREITYLRLSVTDLCDLRCRYCMPAEGVDKRPHGEIYSVEELVGRRRGTCWRWPRWRASWPPSGHMS